MIYNTKYNTCFFGVPNEKPTIGISMVYAFGAHCCHLLQVSDISPLVDLPFIGRHLWGKNLFHHLQHHKLVWEIRTNSLRVPIFTVEVGVRCPHVCLSHNKWTIVWGLVPSDIQHTFCPQLVGLPNEKPTTCISLAHAFSCRLPLASSLAIPHTSHPTNEGILWGEMFGHLSTPSSLSF